MITHDEVLLNDLLDLRLSEAEADGLRERLEREPDLRAAWEAMQRARSALRSDDGIRVPDDFLATVRTRIAHGETDENEGREESSSGGAVPQDAPRLRLRAGGASRLRRIAPYLTAVAALVVVALAVRYRLGGEGGAPERVLDQAARSTSGLAGRTESLRGTENARAGRKEQDPPSSELLAADAWEPEDASPSEAGVLEEVAKSARTQPAPMPPPAASPPPPGGIRVQGPGDQVQPGLRTPTDVPPGGRGRPREAPAGPGKKGEDSRDGATSYAGRGRARDAKDEERLTPVLVTYVLEVENLADGRARLARLLSTTEHALEAREALEASEAKAGVDREEGAEEAEPEAHPALPALPSRPERPEASPRLRLAEREILDHVLLFVTPAEQARLARAATRLPAVDPATLARLEPLERATPAPTTPTPPGSPAPAAGDTPASAAAPAPDPTTPTRGAPAGGAGALDTDGTPAPRDAAKTKSAPDLATKRRGDETGRGSGRAEAPARERVRVLLLRRR